MFKEGEWVIRKWKKSSGGEIDVAKVKKSYADDFVYTTFLRFGGKIIEDLSSTYGKVLYVDPHDRTEFDWRKPTEQEITEYLILEPQPFII